MSIQKYLARYAEPEVEAFSAAISESEAEPKFLSSITAIVVVPAFDESLSSFDSLLLGDHGDAKPLCILVINCPEYAEESAIKRTKDLRNQLIERFKLTQRGTQFWMSNDNFAGLGAAIILIDRCETDRLIPSKQGVGLARKIGMDLALFLNQNIDEQKSEGAKITWIHSLDADVIVPKKYFTALNLLPSMSVEKTSPEVAAALYPFEHMLDSDSSGLGLAFYELTLRYYEERLKWAGSPFAFQTVGSAIAVNLDAYAKVRGMPKRSGAEDFYFLNKLAKIGEIHILKEPVLRISGRPSHRVPFGTGPAIAKIDELGIDAFESYRYYHPRIFVLLKALLKSIQHIPESQTVKDLMQGRTERPASEVTNILQNHLMLDWLSNLKKDEIKALLDHLAKIDFSGFIQHSFRFLENKQAFMSQFNTWFDGFQTLKFVHEMRDQLYANVTVHELRALLEDSSDLVYQRIEQILGLQHVASQHTRS